LGVVRPDTSGEFVVNDLPPGAYFVATVAERPPADANAMWLAGLQSASARVTLTGAQTAVQNIVVK